MTQPSPIAPLHVPGELRWRSLIGILAIFLTLDSLAYLAASRMLGQHAATARTTTDKRLEDMGKRLDTLERDIASITAETAKAAAASAAASKQAKAAADRMAKLERAGQRPPPKPRK